jgi:predicted anti-sigma-YlaC factor YlaD
MNCDECREAISRREAGLTDPDPAMQAEIDAHLEQCKTCRSASGVLKRSLAAMSHKAMTPAPADFLEGSWRRIEKEVRNSQPPLAQKPASTSSKGRTQAIAFLVAIVVAAALAWAVHTYQWLR